MGVERVCTWEWWGKYPALRASGHRGKGGMGCRLTASVCVARRDRGYAYHYLPPPSKPKKRVGRPTPEQVHEHDLVLED